MEYREIIDNLKPELEKAMAYLKKELAEVRTSRASTSLVDSLEVECFGKKMPLKSLGMVSISDKREIVIQPWDESYLDPIAKAISSSSMGLSGSIEGKMIRVPIPPLSEDLRKKMVRLISEKAEQVNKTMRNFRNNAKRSFDQACSSGEIGEDDKFKGVKRLDELISDYGKQIDEIVEAKKKEVLD